MLIPDNILRRQLGNVYFIWGSGKTTAANELARLYGGYVYHTDESRARHCRNADPRYQPALCRDVPDYWALEPSDAQAWERDILREMTPMIIAELMGLSAKYERIWCEGDIDIDAVAAISSNIVTIVNLGDGYDFFDRPDQRSMLNDILRAGLTDEEKRVRLENAYKIVGRDAPAELPREIAQYGVGRIDRDGSSTPEETARLIAGYFNIKE